MNVLYFYFILVFPMFFCAVANAQQKNAAHIIDSVWSLKKDDTEKIYIIQDYAFKDALHADSEIFAYRNVLNEKVDGKTSAPYVKLQSMTNNIFGTYFMYTGKYDSAEQYYGRNLPLGSKYNNKLIVAKAYNNLGNLANHKSNYEQAVDYFQKAVKYAEEINDTGLLASTLGNIANSYVRLKQLDKGILTLNKAIPLAETRHDKRLMANLYNSMATAYGELKNDTLELAYQMKSYKIYKETNNTKGLGTASLNMGGVYLKLRKLDSALQYITESIGYEKKIDDLENLAESYQYLCDIYLKSNKLKQAVSANDSGIYFCQITGDKNLLASTYRLRAEILFSMTDYKSAYEYLNKFRVLNDSIFNKDISARVAEMETKYETAKKEEKIAQQELAISKQKIVSYSIAGLLLLLSVSGYSYYHRSALKQKARLNEEIHHQQNLATKAVLEAEENERNRIASDLHDGVGQTMTAAKMNLSAIESRLSFAGKEDEQLFKTVINLIDSGCKEVRTVSHNMMPNTLIKAGLSAAIKEFVNHLDSRVIKVQLYTEGLDKHIEPSTENVLYRVVQECVNNVIKHSGANHLDISLEKDSQGISVTIEDNGKGFDITNKANQNGLGLKNIETRIKYLNGTVEWSSAPGKGTIVAIHVPA